MNYVIRQMEEIVSTLENMDKDQIRQMPVYQTRLMLRDALLAAGIDGSVSGKLALRAKINVSQNAFTNYHPLVVRMVDGVAKLSVSLLSSMQADFPGVPVDCILESLDGLSIELDV